MLFSEPPGKMGDGVVMVVMATSERLQFDGGTRRLWLSKAFFMYLSGLSST